MVDTIVERGICYSKTNSEPTILDSKLICGSGNGSFNTSIIDLSLSTQYYLRVYAINDIGVAYGNTISISTKDGQAKVALGTINNIMTTTATATMSVTDVGGATLQNCGICWSTNANPTISDNKIEAGGNSLNRIYSCNMSNLSAGTTYNLCAYATTNITTVYSAASSFTTLFEVSGVVKNESDEVIPNAIITFMQNNKSIKSVTSDINGKFSLQIESGTYNLEVTATGYVKLTQEVYVDSNPIILVMQQLGFLSGTVYDDDDIPLANAEVTVKTTVNNKTYQYSATSNSDGTYRIENIQLGYATIGCSLSNYELTSQIPNKNIISGNNKLNIHMTISTAGSINPWALTFDCQNEGMCGTTVTKIITIQNNRQKEVSWSLSGVPSNGVVFSQSSGTIAAKSSITITATFTYPGPNVSGSVKYQLSGCVLNNQTWTYTYLWNWSESGTHNNNVCIAYCSQDGAVLIGNNSYRLNLFLWQGTVWR